MYSMADILIEIPKDRQTRAGMTRLFISRYTAMYAKVIAKQSLKHLRMNIEWTLREQAMRAIKMHC